MSYQHGISILERPTPVIPPIQTSAGVQVVVGTAPIHLAKDYTRAVNNPIITYSWGEAVENLGYSDDWDKFTLCQSMDVSYRRFNVAPVIFINVLDPKVHKEDKENETVNIVNKVAGLEVQGVLLDSIVVKGTDAATTYEKDVDYDAGFDKDGNVVINILEGGNIQQGIAELKLNYTKLDPKKVTKLDIIGGYDAAVNKYYGLELVNQVYPKFGVVPGLLLAPGWSHIPEVASVIDAKSIKINGNFNCMNVLDIDSEEVVSYQDAREWKNNHSYTSQFSMVCYPKVQIGERKYWYSAIIAALTAYTDAQNDDVPYKSPSNKRLPITGTVLADGTEVFLDQLQGNFLNGAGIITAININGWRSWGNNTAVYPASTDPKDRFIPIRRVFNWWGNTFIQTYFQKVDEPTNYRLIESIVDSENIRGNGLQAKGQIAGAKIEFLEAENPMTDILNGKITFIQKIGAFPPAEDIVNILEFDPTILSDALFGGDQ
ncbi:putative phage tail sheath protein [Clostridium aceticum]|uniref:Putative phage tail sheath protein n=1 Tax=Clostridium aceticum TaxID=84022 RepID=A0A0D8IC89_9CLOT|nr:hypothetical protein [Clostridium aceticum]AKL95015.1 putative phage tail sheath protein [Clostridium aceticum]KJF27915.1 hypothetical protein TZ02_04885 [Clostridium aceticum]